MAEREPIEREQVRLATNWLNAMAAGVVTTGVVAPTIMVLFGIANVSLGVAFLTTIGWLLSGCGLHYAAQRLLRRFG